MLEKGKCNKNGTENIGIQAFDAILQLSVGYRLILEHSHISLFVFVYHKRKSKKND